PRKWPRSTAWTPVVAAAPSRTRSPLRRSVARSRMLERRRQPRHIDGVALAGWGSEVHRGCPRSRGPNVPAAVPPDRRLEDLTDAGRRRYGDRDSAESHPVDSTDG